MPNLVEPQDTLCCMGGGGFVAIEEHYGGGGVAAGLFRTQSQDVLGLASHCTALFQRRFDGIIFLKDKTNVQCSTNPLTMGQPIIQRIAHIPVVRRSAPVRGDCKRQIFTNRGGFTQVLGPSTPHR